MRIADDGLNFLLIFNIYWASVGGDCYLTTLNLLVPQLQLWNAYGNKNLLISS